MDVQQANALTTAMNTLCMAFAVFTGWVADVQLGRFMCLGFNSDRGGLENKRIPRTHPLTLTLMCLYIYIYTYIYLCVEEGHEAFFEDGLNTTSRRRVGTFRLV